jgi:hypothetical protein
MDKLHADLIEDILLLAFLTEDAVEGKRIATEPNFPLGVIHKVCASQTFMVMWSDSYDNLNGVLSFHCLKSLEFES